ncbi:MAG: PAS domain S-box protein [Deltaproteobacteria bacterium]|nr:PAS domain S-box protein [Deltaproteobacteria bacterium]MBW2417073.1 PAS domain S-box protein [Deltaproteobacteria bacterium]
MKKQTQEQDWWSADDQPSGGLLQDLTKVSVPRYLAVVVPLTVVFLLGFLLEYRAEVGAERARFLTQESSIIERAVRRIQREAEIASGDLFFVRDLVAGALDADDPSQLAALERSLLALVRHRAGYFQVRLIGATGQEIIRVEDLSGTARVAPASELQNKGDRPYFRDTMGLRVGEAFVSPMELNIERGVVEEPRRSVVRLATPIDDEAGRRHGIVVLNARGERFLRAFELNADRAGVQRMIVDPEGYWLQHRPEVEWGFMLEHGRSFQRTFPDVWERMTEGQPGPIESSDGLFFFETVSQRPSAARADTHVRGFWILISLVPRALLDDIAVRTATRLLVIAMPLLFTLLLVGWLLAAALERRRAAHEALQRLERVRSKLMTAALDGIVVMNEKGIVLEFNPMAQRIFGYTPGEVQGMLVADLIIPPTHREAHRVGLEHYLATGEGPIIDKHIDELTAMRKGGAEFPVELTVCPMMIAGKQLFFGFLRDLTP